LISFEQIIKYSFKNNQLKISRMIILEYWRVIRRGNYYLDRDFL
jgi:hypothetical protein